MALPPDLLEAMKRDMHRRRGDVYPRVAQVFGLQEVTIRGWFNRGFPLQERGVHDFCAFIEAVVEVTGGDDTIAHLQGVALAGTSGEPGSLPREMAEAVSAAADLNKFVHDALADGELTQTEVYELLQRAQKLAAEATEVGRVAKAESEAGKRERRPRGRSREIEERR